MYLDPNLLEITETQYSHPDITAGQHANGPTKVFLRHPEIQDGAWISCYTFRRHHILAEVLNFGLERIADGTWKDA